MEAPSQHLGKPQPDRGLGKRYHSIKRVIWSSVPGVSDLLFPPPEADDHASPFMLDMKMEPTEK